MTCVRFTVPLVPPTVNHYAKHTRTGQHYVTKEATAFKHAVAIFARGMQVKAKQYTVSIKVWLGENQRGDVDNFLKCALDGLTAAGVIHSDAAITKLTIEKDRDSEHPRTDFVVEAV